MGGETPVVFTWRSNTAGRYDVVPGARAGAPTGDGAPGHRAADRRCKAPLRQTLSLLVRGACRCVVQPGEGKAGLVSFWLRAHYLETFAETRYLDTQSTTQSGTPRNATCV